MVISSGIENDKFHDAYSEIMLWLDKIKAGEFTDSAVIYKTDKARPEYKLKKGDSSNWM